MKINSDVMPHTPATDDEIISTYSEEVHLVTLGQELLTESHQIKSVKNKLAKLTAHSFTNFFPIQMRRQQYKYDVAYRKGNKRFNQGDYAQAVFYYNLCLQIKPSALYALFNKSLALSAMGSGEEALECMGQYKSFYPDDMAIYFNRALLLKKLQRYAESLEEYEIYLAHHPLDNRAIYYRAIVLNELGRHEEAFHEFNRCKSLGLETNKFYAHYGYALNFLDQKEKALNSLEKYLNCKPDKVIPLYLTAEILAQSGYIEQALERYHQCLRLNPNFNELLPTTGYLHNTQHDSAQKNQMHQLYLSETIFSVNDSEKLFSYAYDLQCIGHIDIALEYYARLEQLNFDNCEALLEIAKIYCHINQDEKAIALYEQCILLTPDKVRIYIMQGFSLEKLNRDEEAIRKYKTYLTHRPDSHDAIFRIAMVNYKRKCFHEALLWVNDFFTIPSYPQEMYSEVLYLAGNIHYQLAIFERAQSYYQHCLTLNPNHAEAQFSLGNTYFVLGKNELAIQSYQACLHLHPHHFGALYNLGKTFDVAEDFNAALAVYDKCLLLQPNNSCVMRDRYSVQIALRSMTLFSHANASATTAHCDESANYKKNSK